MRQLLATDTRAASNALVAVLLAGVVAISATAGGAVIINQYQQDISEGSEIVRSQVETPTQAQVHITSLVGDNLPLENTKVRIEFLDRNASSATVTNVQAAKQSSTAISGQVNQSVQTADRSDPVTETVTYYEPNGTTNELELDVYKWERTKTYETVKRDDYDVPVKRWEIVVNGVGKYGGEAFSHYAYCESTHSSMYACDRKREDIADDDDHTFDSIYAISYVTTTKNKTFTYKSPKDPGSNWTKVEKVGTKTYDLNSTHTIYDRKTVEAVVGYNINGTTKNVSRNRTVYVASAATNANRLSLGGTGAADNKDVDADAEADNDVAAGVGSQGDVADLSNISQALSNADDNATFLETSKPNTAAGVGGSIGSSESDLMSQGETLIIQLDQPLLFNDERISVEIINTKTNNLVMDRNVRVDSPNSVAFSPDGTAAPADEAPPDIDDPDVNVSGPDLPDDSIITDPPEVDLPDSDDGDSGDEAEPDSTDTNPDITGDTDKDGDDSPDKNIDCRFNQRIAQAGYACVGDQKPLADDTITGGYVAACEMVECGKSSTLEIESEVDVDTARRFAKIRQDKIEDDDESDDDGYKPRDSDDSDSSSGSNYTDMSGNGNAGHIAP